MMEKFFWKIPPIEKKVGLAISGILGLKSKMVAKFTEKAVRSSGV